MLRDLISPADFVLDFRPADKWDAIRRLVDHLVAVGRIPAREAGTWNEQVLERERSMSTGMERGVAIPHAAVDGLERVVAAVGVLGAREGLSFDSIDARPTQVVVLLLIPRAQKLLHIRTLADIARVLSRDSVREGLLAAQSPEQAWNALVAGEAARSTG